MARYYKSHHKTLSSWNPFYKDFILILLENWKENTEVLQFTENIIRTVNTIQINQTELHAGWGHTELKQSGF